MTRRPAAFEIDRIALEDDNPQTRRGPYIEPEPDIFAEPSDDALIEVATERPPRRFMRWFWIAAGGLTTLGIGLAIDTLVRALFARTDWLGWIGLGLVALAALALLAFAVREAVGLVRVRRITHIQANAREVIENDAHDDARDACTELIELYGHRPETANGRVALSRHLQEIIDGRDLMGLAETELLLPLDREARRLVLSSAKRVSLVTAISPRALIDVLFVLAENLRLIRRLATIYGGRPGTFGFLRLARRAISHLAITGGMAAGESIFQQVLGHGIAARISTRLGEGVINGILTARIGIAAIDVCRPLPFVLARPTRLADIVAELTKAQPNGDAPPPPTDGPG